MSRRRKSVKRQTLPDPKYKNVVVSRFVNSIMTRGKKSIAERIVYNAFGIIEEKMEKDPLEIFLTALDNVKPLVRVVSRRVGGSNYQIPIEVPAATAQALAFRWLISYSRARSEKNMDERLAGELMAAFRKEGNSIKKREDTHKMAEANKAFAHLRW